MIGSINLPTLLAAYARAADVSALARGQLAQANLAALPTILRGMGRPMPLVVQERWLWAVENGDVLTLRAIAVHLAARRPGTPGGPRLALLEAIVQATGAALSLRDLSEHYAETGTLPCGVTST